MSSGRLSVLFAIAAAIALALTFGVATNAHAGIGDDVCPDTHGENTNTCPPGQVGVPYSITFRLPPGQGCSPGDDVWSIVGGNSPPGLSMSSSGTLSGTPTQAGTFQFFIQMALPDNENCNGSKDTTQRGMTLTVNPAVPTLILGPESTTPATKGSPYSLQMTASLPDAKTFSISVGALPPGLTIDPANGLISGTPTTSGAYSFTVYAKLNGDARSDTKPLQIVVRDPLAIGAGEPFERQRAPGEVRVPFDSTLQPSGGSGIYTWTLASGSLPPGIAFVNGAFSGSPRAPGVYPFTVSVADNEGRTANYNARISVATKLAITTAVLRPAKIGKAYAAKLKTAGGIRPTAWRISAGKLPKGIRFDPVLGALAGVATKAGRYRVGFEATDSLGVTARKTLAVSVVG